MAELRHPQRHRLAACVTALVCVVMGASAQASPPNIVVIIADDLGWNDVGFRNAQRAKATPNIDRMAREGVQLSNSYMQQVCTPSRAAFLSGKYPFKMGLQHSVFNALRNNSMPLDMRLLPQDLQAAGYGTHYVGKWHLGFCNYDMTPTRRGFDTFYGMYNGMGGYWNHLSKHNGYDMHSDTGPNVNDYHVDRAADGVYSTELFTDKTIQLLQQHDQAKPLFLVLSYQAVHGPLDVPDSYVQKYCADYTSGDSASSTAADRKLHCALTAAMDEGIGNVTSALDSLGFSDNLITLFISDNGGPVKIGSSNWPLRGSKITMWEGGMKAVTLLHSRTHLPNAPYTWDGMMHATDWYPTLMKASGQTGAIAGIDGKDNWQAIVDGGASQRTELVYNINDVTNNAAIRDGNYKLIEGKGGSPDGWYNPPPGVAERAAPRLRVPYLLFDLAADPNEETNLSEQTDMQGVKDALVAKLEAYKTHLKPSVPFPKVVAGKPRKHGGNWVSGWC